MKTPINSDFRTVRGYQLVNQREGQLTSAMEDYLEMAYRLCSEHHYTRVVQLSALLHVKPSSVSKMVLKLVELGYLEYDSQELILLTEKGYQYGTYLLYRHNTVEQFLKLIGNANPLKETELVEHSLSPSTVLHLDSLLTYFERNENVRIDFKMFQKRKEEKE